MQIGGDIPGLLTRTNVESVPEACEFYACNLNASGIALIGLQVNEQGIYPRVWLPAPSTGEHLHT